MKKAKKKYENKSDAVTFEVRRLGVMLEHVDDKVSLVAEQYGDIKKDTGMIRKTIDVHTEMIGKLAVNIEIVKEDIEFIKSGFKKKVDVEEFAALSRRVSLLEKHQ
ncbi:MAG: hypothetical protein Q7K26_05135 [bacterium]|nr:hypothetical protein [bacterium]